MPLEFVRNDITKMKVDVVVNSANPRAIVGGGVDRAIHKAAGPELLIARQRIGNIATGKAFITPGYNLLAQYVIHTVGPVWQDGKHGERELLADCYKNSLQLAADYSCKAIAFPLISAGIFGCPPEIAIAVATRAIREFIDEYDLDVYMVMFDRESFKISSSLFDDVQNYIDEVYVDEHLAQESCNNYQRRREREAALYRNRGTDSRSLDEILNDMTDTFSEALLKLIDAKGMTDPQVYKRANINRKHFSKIRNNQAYKPKKSTVFALSIALELNIAETRELLARAGYAFSHSNVSDVIIEYFIKQGKYDIDTINQVLFEKGEPTLGV
ncbi:macro domain-containing protein [uncultured Anaerovibrio sp.]|uniref:macro domain-containing protein n=1 Tax=uncultured Anaerovibrio sp. TaxID=361586 RepID=UPI00261B8379|nr:macro domain-containing protein [uncultured Anaerovibrio sp.]